MCFPRFVFIRRRERRDFRVDFIFGTFPKKTEKISEKIEENKKNS